MKLHGTTTSPYVRRVRVVAAELGVPLELSITASPAGQAALRALTPIWKVPIAEIGGQVVFDSRVIIERLVREHGYGALRPPGAGTAGWVREHNLISVVDAALDAAINVRYLELEGIEASRAPYLTKQRERAATCLGWLAGELRGQWLTDEPRLGLAEVAY